MAAGNKVRAMCRISGRTTLPSAYPSSSDSDALSSTMFPSSSRILVKSGPLLKAAEPVPRARICTACRSNNHARIRVSKR